QEIKFKLFLETSLEDGADLIATGHYAKTKDGQLFTAKNLEKDQTYFLYRVAEGALRKTLFPIGELKTKADVRQLAKDFKLATADKKDSQGICFVGKVGVKDFLSQYVKTKPGNILDQSGKKIGEHEGAIFYTIGQRHGLNTGGGLPYYVVGKNMAKNEVYVTTNLDDENLWHKELTIAHVHWINKAPDFGRKYLVRTRYRAPLIAASLKMLKNKNLKISLDEPVRAITAGQSAVIYDKDKILGGGLIA
ncbi:MAG TPA: tRNA 2-thiouridine(34) synthase MnmA, partial [Patescibacteria group bacterium]|nr:tRNA 2-thiouridine(34) synthase MnmA [Patescibacteria group bacterium]